MNVQWNALFVLLGTFLPFIGLGATLVAALVLRGIWRWAALVCIPMATLALCYLIAEPVMRDGNLLAAVTFVSLYLFLCVYYPVLGIVAIALWVRRRRQGSV
jgi:hypothetical protein